MLSRMMVAIGLVGAAVILPPPADGRSEEQVLPPPPGSQWPGEWRLGALEDHVRDSGRVEAAAAEIGSLEGVYSLLVLHEGELVLERYFREGRRNKPHNLKSASKSILSALTGIAVAEGRLRLDQPLTDFLEQARDLPPGPKKDITVGDLLSMTTGLAGRSYESYNELIADDDWVASALRAPLVEQPGTRFQYSTGNTHLLSAVLSAATGMSTRRFAEQKLFGPMGVEIRGWDQDPRGIHVGGNNFSLLPRDMAKFGQLYLDGGRWGDEQLIPWSWVVETTAPRPHGFHEVYGNYAHLWYADLVYEAAFVAVGYGGQYIFVSPAHDSVVVVTSDLESKGMPWTTEIFGLIRADILGEIEPSASYYTRLGRRAADPELDSLQSAIARAERGVALLLADPDRAAVAELPRVGWTKARVNLRQGAATTTPRIRLLDHGERLEVREIGDGWLRVRAGSEEGWVSADYVELRPTSWRDDAIALRNELEIFSRGVATIVGVEAFGAPTAAEPVPSPAESRGPPPAESVRQDLQAELQEVVAQLESLEAKLETSESAGDSLRAQLAEQSRNFESRRAERNAELDLWRAAATRLAEDLARDKGSNPALEDALTGKAAATNELRQAVARIAELEAVEGDLHTLLAAHESDLFKERERASVLEAALEASEAAEAAASEQLGEQSRALERRDAELSAELEASRSQLESLATELEESVQERTRLAQDLIQERGRSDELEAAMKRIAALESVERDLRAGFAAQESELSAERQRASVLEAALEVSEAAEVGARERLAAQSQTLESREAALQANEAAAVADRERLAAENQAVERREAELRGELEAARSQLASLGTELDESTSERGKLAEDLARERGRSQELGAALARIAALESVEADLRESLAARQADLSTERERASVLEAPLEKVAAVEPVEMDLRAGPTTGAVEEASPPREPVEEDSALALATSVEQTVLAWAVAWSSQDVEAYLAFYDRDFAVPNGLSRTAWEEQRRVRLTAPSRIAVGLSEIDVKPSGPNRASATFRQHYRTEVRNLFAKKVFDLTRVGGQWRILRERVVD